LRVFVGWYNIVRERQRLALSGVSSGTRVYLKEKKQ
jgi:hypothetical protein